VYQDPSEYGPDVKPTGAEGISTEQVLRAAIVKALFGYTYRDLAFHIVDSGCLRPFFLIGFGGGFHTSALQKNVMSLSSETWEEINRVIIGYAKQEKIETGRALKNQLAYRHPSTRKLQKRRLWTGTS
jgi:IS5 family transposase